MKFSVLLIISSFCLLVAAEAGAQQAQPGTSIGVAPNRDASKHLGKAVKAAASKKAKAQSQTSASAGHEALPCPRATWRDDPVCADTADEHTLPTPSSHGVVSPAPAAEPLSVGVGWRASNDQRLPGYDSTPMLDSVRKNIPDATVSNPGSRMDLGLKFGF
ncbi:MAG TPA: hypothetical protein VEK34_07585 [Methylocella sp.]|nr:hypothetical protein [Methylocella sp.]